MTRTSPPGSPATGHGLRPSSTWNRVGAQYRGDPGRMRKPPEYAKQPPDQTHKSPILQRCRIEAGAHAFTCQKLGESRGDRRRQGSTTSDQLQPDRGKRRMGEDSARYRQKPKWDCRRRPIRPSSRACRKRRRSGRPLSVVVNAITGRKRRESKRPLRPIAMAREIAASKGLTFAGFHALSTRWRVEAQKFYDEAFGGVRAQGWSADRLVSTAARIEHEERREPKGARSIGPAPISTTTECSTRRRRELGRCAMNIIRPWSDAASPNRGSSTPGSQDADLGYGGASTVRG